MLSGILTWVQPHSLQGPKLLSKKYEVSQGNKIHTHTLTSAFPFPSSFSKIRLLYLRSDFNKTNAAFLTVSLKAKKEPEKHFSGQNYSLLLVSIHFPTFTFHFLAFWNLYSFFLLMRTLVNGPSFHCVPGPPRRPGAPALCCHRSGSGGWQRPGVPGTETPVRWACPWKTTGQRRDRWGSFQHSPLPTLPAPWNSLSTGLTFHWFSH